MYTDLSAQLYDYWHPELDKHEYGFYKQLVRRAEGAALELGCGTGRLLLPLIKQGYGVEGVDFSQDMLDICRRKAVQQDIQPILYQQKIEELALPKKYTLIFSALETFQQIVGRNDAVHALRALYDHLQLGGMVAISLSLPWLYAPSHANEWREINQATVDGMVYTLHEKSIHDPIEQIFYHYYRITTNGTIAYEYDTSVRWYSRYEFEALLASVGFKFIQMQSGYTGDGPQDMMLFTAQK